LTKDNEVDEKEMDHKVGEVRSRRSTSEPIPVLTSTIEKALASGALENDHTTKDFDKEKSAELIVPKMQVRRHVYWITTSPPPFLTSRTSPPLQLASLVAGRGGG
jgi:hypothetical protein